MSDKYTLEISGFRSIRSASVDIAPLTVVYGPNGSGKSSLIYALLTLKNFLTNPNRNRPSLFNYPSLSLGDFEEVARGHDVGSAVSFSLKTVVPDRYESKYALAIAESGGRSSISVRAAPPLPWDRVTWENIKLDLDIPFPYSGNQSMSFNIEIENESWDDSVSVDLDGFWNGIGLSGAPSDSEFQEVAFKWIKDANAPLELARSTGFVPLRRGFAIPLYGVVNVTPDLATDNEVASLLANDRFLEYAVSDYMEKVADTRIQVRPKLGVPAFTIDSIPRNGRVPTSIVNEGFGINQIAYMFAIALSPGAKIVAIEEPEIHLHPAMIRKLALAMVDIVANSDKRIIVSTHSETFVLALLTRVITGEIGLDDVSFIHADNSGGESVFSKKEVKPNGQIEDGLSAFEAGESEDIAIFLGLDPKDPLGTEQ